MSDRPRYVPGLGLVACLGLVAGCSRPVAVHAFAGPRLVRPSLVDTRGSLPVKAGAGGLAGAQASLDVGRKWTLAAGALTAYGRFASTELPTDTSVRLTSWRRR